jgi:hypothetical protein
MKLRLTLVALSAVCAAFLACSSSSSKNNGGGGGSDAGGGGGGEEGGGAVDAGPTTNAAHVGTVNFIQYTNPMYWSATGYFISNADVSTVDPAAAGCTTDMSGSCSYKSCMAIDSGVAPLPTYVSAGSITVSGGSIPSGTVLTKDDGGIYSMMAVGMDVVVKNGDTITVSATGGDVPAFTALKVVAAPSYMLTSPPCSTDCGPLDRTTDLPVTWTGLNDGKIHITLFTASGGPSQTIACDFPASDGKGTIPTSLLSKLPSTGSVGVNVESLNDAQTVPGDYGVTLHFQGDNTGGTMTIAK